MNDERKKMNFFSSGQTLAEIVVALGIVLILVTGLIVGGTSAVRTSDQGRMRSNAIQYAQEGIELTRKRRDENWATFQATNGLWCLDGSGIWTQAVGVCPVNIGNAFTRGVTFAWNAGALRMEVTMTVTWQDGSATHKSELVTYFTQWQ